MLINSLIKKWALWFPSLEITADKDSNQSFVSRGSISAPLLTWIIGCFFSGMIFFISSSFSLSFWTAITSSACLIIFSVSFGIVAAVVVTVEDK